MEEEYLDIVDENNVPTGQRELRSVVHATGLWHRVVHVYIFKRVGSNFVFLCHLRSKYKDTNPNKWTTKFGGHIKAGETLKDGTVNEIKEEIGLGISIPDLIEGVWMKRNLYPNCEYNKIFFLDYTGKMDDFKFDDGEVQDVKWLASDEIYDTITNNFDHWGASPERFVHALEFLKDYFSKN